jgi:hypothetical protein
MASNKVQPRDINERFDSKWKLDEVTGCHVWTRKPDPYGYGVFGIKVDGRWRRVRASRWSLERALGRPIAPGLSALHRCDNPPCVNPDHLYEGDQLRNITDAVERGRMRPWNAGKGVCINGHEFTPENTMVWQGGGRKVPMRKCRICHRARMREVMRRTRERKRAEAAG